MHENYEFVLFSTNLSPPPVLFHLFFFPLSYMYNFFHSKYILLLFDLQKWLNAYAFPCILLFLFWMVAHYRSYILCLFHWIMYLWSHSRHIHWGSCCPSWHGLVFSCMNTLIIQPLSNIWAFRLCPILYFYKYCHNQKVCTDVCLYYLRSIISIHSHKLD